MTLTWLGHSCFLLESSGYRVVLDPYYVETYPPLHVAADRALCSHTHRDHAFLEAVSLSGHAEEDCPFTIETLATFHDEVCGAKRGENTIHILHVEGLTVVHCGDLGHELSEAQLAKLRGCDAMLVPVGGYYTIDASAAKALVDALAPRVVVPMHYRFGSHGYDVIATADDFLARFDAAAVHRLGGNCFTLTADSPSGIIVPRFAE